MSPPDAARAGAEHPGPSTRTHAPAGRHHGTAGVNVEALGLTRQQQRFLLGASDELPPGVLDDHETWLATDAPAEHLVQHGLIEEPGDVEVGRRTLIEEARWRLAERQAGLDLPQDDGPAEVSPRTAQRRLRRYRDEVARLVDTSAHRSGPTLSTTSAADQVRATWDPDSGRWHKTCPVCGEAFASTRSDAITCSPACRKRRQTGATTRLRWTAR